MVDVPAPKRIYESMQRKADTAIRSFKNITFARTSDSFHETICTCQGQLQQSLPLSVSVETYGEEDIPVQQIFLQTISEVILSRLTVNDNQYFYSIAKTTPKKPASSGQ